MIMELLDSNLSSQAINARTVSQDKGPSDSTLLLSSFVGTLLIGLWITPNWLLNLVFLRKSYLEESGFIYPSSALVWLPTAGSSIWETEGSRTKNMPSSASGPLEKVISAFWIKYWWCNSENETTRDFKGSYCCTWSTPRTGIPLGSYLTPV